MTTKKAQHTPGPWVKLPGDLTVGARGCTVAEVIPQNTAEANASLIAAAPDLLAALQALLPYHQCEWQEPSPYFQDILDDAKAAIRKAKAGAK
jgi:hypothetical protein